MNTRSKSAVPRNKSPKSDEAMIRELMRDLRKRECKRCHYAVDLDGVCSNLDCPNWRDIATHIPLYHGRRWGRLTFDAERLCLVFDANPTVRESGKDRYIAFLGCYEADLERLRTSAAVLDFACQIEGSIWGVNNGVRDFFRAIDDLLDPQASLCSFGTNKVIENPREFLAQRIAASVANRGAK
jgi:hypothetical protein